MHVFSLQHLKLSLVPWLCDPTDVAGCIFWLRASVGVETLDAQGHVKMWTDQVAHLPVGPVSATHAPVHLDYVPALNGLPGIGFYVGTQMLHKVGGIPLPWDEEPFSMFAVCSPENAGEVNAMVALWAGTLPHAGLRFSSTGELQGWCESLYDAGSSPKQFAPHVVGMTYNGLGTLKLYVDGTLVASHGGLYVAAQDAGGASVLAIGADSTGADGFRGHLGDLVIFDRALDDDDVQFLTTALEAHYKMYSGWLTRLFNNLVGAGHAVANLIGGELRHLLGDAGANRRAGG